METEKSVPSSDSLVTNTNVTNDNYNAINAHGIQENEAATIGATSAQNPKITKSQSDDVIQSSPSKPCVNGFIDKSNSCDIERKLNETQNSLNLINSHESNIGYADDDDSDGDGDEHLGACYVLSFDKGTLKASKPEDDKTGKQTCACVLFIHLTNISKFRNKKRISNILIQNI